MPELDDYVHRVRALLWRVKEEVSQYYVGVPERKPNYEDLSYVVSQIADSESGEYDNPALLALSNLLRTDLAAYLGSSPTSGEWDLNRVAHEASKFIACIAWSRLDRSTSREDHAQLSALTEGAADPTFGRIVFATLNHDSLLEDALEASSIPLVDGFGTSRNRVRYWEAERLLKPAERVLLLKLHGSVRWFHFREENDGRDRIGIPEDSDFWHTRGDDGCLQWPLEGRPSFLVGTFNKILEYTNKLYLTLHWSFVSNLERSRHLLVCGYGFGDKGINRYLAHWLEGDSERRMIIVHPNGDRLISRARGVLQKNWADWRERGQLVIIEQCSNDVQWRDIRSVI